MIKNYFLLIIFIFFVQCGYNPIYSQNNQNFQIKNIELNKNKNNKVLETRLSNYKVKKDPLYFYDLKILTSENKSILSKMERFGFVFQVLFICVRSSSKLLIEAEPAPETA